MNLWSNSILNSDSFNVLTIRILLSKKKKKLRDFPVPVWKLCTPLKFEIGMRDSYISYSPTRPLLMFLKIFGACSVTRIVCWSSESYSLALSRAVSRLVVELTYA